jgi:class 3 adenylate cyclase
VLKSEYYYRWEWQLQASPAALWPLVSDTNRFNRDTGVPAVEVRTPGSPPSNERRLLRLYRFGVPIEWEEEPFEWVRPYRFGVVRHYTRGPVAEMRTLTELNPRPNEGTRLIYQVWARPRNLFGHVAIPAQIGLLSYRGFDRAFRLYDQAATSARPSPLQLPGGGQLAPGARERLDRISLDLVKRGVEPELVELLVDLIEHADDMALFRLRPYALADFWEKPRRAALEMCLQATRAGLLNFRWDLLCPLCRGNRGGSDSLSGIRAEVHCDSCNIDFTVNFDRSVELTFRPNPAIRETPDSTYCVGGPQVTPHIVAQQLLPASVEREMALTLDAGRYRLRTFSQRGGQALAADPAGAEQASLVASDQAWPGGETLLSVNPTLVLRNQTSVEQLFILERMAWSDQAATAAEVTSLQMFRDLFANEALRPGERITVGSLTVLFTDLRDSTRLYRESGDAVAFGQVLDHYEVLRKAINQEEGALVKTIGDSVMAVFQRPVQALRAVFRAQAVLANPPDGRPTLYLKAGIHCGPCVAVTLNDRLDYFGSTVNLAARLEAVSATRPGVVVSSAVIHDPEVAEWKRSDGARAEPFTTAIKGFDDEPIELWAVTPARAVGAVLPQPPSESVRVGMGGRE